MTTKPKPKESTTIGAVGQGFTATPITDFGVLATEIGTLDTTTIDLSGLTMGSISLGANGTSATDWLTQGAVGSPNTVWTTTGTGYNWSTPSAPTTISAGGRMSLHGEQADVEINGKSMAAWMEKVEERLNILTPNPELEKEWDELRRLGERYRKLEKKCKEKAEIWNKLKSMPPPKV